MTTQFMTEIEKEDLKFTKLSNLFGMAAFGSVILMLITFSAFAFTVIYKMWA
jgi:hypothetical protein